MKTNKTIPEVVVLNPIIGKAVRYKEDGTQYVEEYHQPRVFRKDLAGRPVEYVLACINHTIQPVRRDRVVYAG